MKKKILAIVLCVAMLAIAIVGGTMAYFTDTQEQVNTFTAGKVDIILYEHIAEKDEVPTSKSFGDYIATDKLTQKDQSYHLFPAMTVAKDPTIRVEKGSEDAYVAAIVTVKGDLQSLIGVLNTDMIDINLIADGGLLDLDYAEEQDWNKLPLVHKNDTCVIYQDTSKAANKEWDLYIFMTEPMAAEETVTLFDTLNIPKEWNNAEMAKVNKASITVNAYATQTNGFDTCFKAITTAFENEFKFN